MVDTSTYAERLFVDTRFVAVMEEYKFVAGQMGCLGEVLVYIVVVMLVG